MPVNCLPVWTSLFLVLALPSGAGATYTADWDSLDSRTVANLVR
uniref:Uncharacterized protein n=1 Tax=Anguilla anguilla TaxID=7936 RepID=A0A0E9S1A0_ANGAN